MIRKAKEQLIGKQPKITKKPKLRGVVYTYTCDVCAKNYGPEKSLIVQVDGGKKFMKKYYMECTKCGKFACIEDCWNYKKGACGACEPIHLPETISKKSTFKVEYYYICQICRDQLGPIKNYDWGKIKGIAATSALLGLNVAKMATGNVLDGASGVIKTAAKADINSSIKKRDKEEIKSGAIQQELAQCPKCSRWVCTNKCWDRSTGYCTSYSK